MDYMTLIVSFLALMLVFIGFSGFVLYRVFVSNTDGAVRRLDDEYASATKKHAELNKKLRHAEDELTKRRTEARQLSDKMHADAEEETKAERDKILKEARDESEEILIKAKGATETLRLEMEKEMDSKFIRYSMDILQNILGDHATGAFNEVLINEYIKKLNNVDLVNIGHDVKEVEIVSAAELNQDASSAIKKILSEKTGRDFSIKSKVDKSIAGGLILKFGSMALDGSLHGLIREEGTKLQQEVDDRR